MSEENDLQPGTRRETNMIESDEANHAITGVALPIMELLNKYSKDHGATHALYGLLYATGAALANYGAVLDESVDLRSQLSPLFEGHKAQMDAEAEDQQPIH